MRGGWAKFAIFGQYVAVSHGSADTVVRATNVKYRKWCLGNGVL